jgi:hypothetical protein
MKKISIALILTSSLLLLPAMLTNITLFSTHPSLFLQGKDTIANDISYEFFTNDFSTLSYGSDRNVLPKVTEPFPESTAPSINVTILLLGMGIVGFAGRIR